MTCSLSVPDLLAPELVRESHIAFLDLSTYELAYQVTVRDYYIFRNVLPTDYVVDIFHRFGGPKDPSEIKAMKTLEALVNDEMFWVIHEVCQETNVQLGFEIETSTHTNMNRHHNQIL